MKLLTLLFHYVKIISSLNCFLNFIDLNFPRSHHLPARPIRICYMKGKIFKIKNAIVTFISIGYSEPRILTRTCTIIFSCPFLSERKINSPCTSPRLSSEFCRTIHFPNCLVVCHYHDFSPKQLRSSEPFFNISVFLK